MEPLKAKANSTYQSIKDMYPEQLFLSKKETATVLGISTSGVLNYINAKNGVLLKSTKFGSSSQSSVRILISDLAIFIDSLSSSKGV